MQLRITIAMCMVEIRNRKTLQSKVNICKSDVKIGDCADSLGLVRLLIVTIDMVCSTVLIATFDVCTLDNIFYTTLMINNY